MSEQPGPFEKEDEDEVVDEAEESARLREKRGKARRVLSRAMLLILCSLGIYAIWPWLMPAFIWEGPMVQDAEAEQLTLVWYMTRPAGGDYKVRLGEGGREFAAERSGRRCRAVLSGLPTNTELTYTILLNSRILGEHRLRTSRTADRPFSFVVFGDSGKATAAQYVLADRITAADPDFVLHTGDLIYGRGERRLYRGRFFTPYEDLLSRVAFWPCVGNHDVYPPIEQSPYFRVFDFPKNGPAEIPVGHEYWFDYAQVRVAVLDSEQDEDVLRERVAPWLRGVFNQSDAVWKLVVFHRPPFTAGKHHPCERVQRALVPVFEEVGVDIVFNGHDHMYQRTRPIRGGKAVDEGGVVYIVSGAGGARLYDVLPLAERPDYFAVVDNTIHSFTQVSIDGGRLSLKQIDLNGQTLDTWTQEKTPKEP